MTSAVLRGPIVFHSPLLSVQVLRGLGDPTLGTVLVTRVFHVFSFSDHVYVNSKGERCNVWLTVAIESRI